MSTWKPDQTGLLVNISFWRLIFIDTFLYQTSRQLKIGISDINMKFTGFAVSFPTGKLKALLIIFNNCFVYAHFSAFKWEIVNYFVIFTVFFSGTYLFAVESAKNYDKNFCILWNQLLKIMTMALSKQEDSKLTSAIHFSIVYCKSESRDFT